MNWSAALRRGATCAIAIMVAALLMGLPGASAVQASVGCAGTVKDDFNGDGISDAAIGEFAYWNSGKSHVHILYGTRSGLTANASGTALDDQLLGDSADIWTGFGSALATGDFNGDGCTDLAVGDPFALDAAGDYVGDVRIYWGSLTGLTYTGTKLVATQAPGGTQKRDDQWGSVLAVGDFTGDGAPDLAVGSLSANPGEVTIFRGHTGSTTLTGAKRFLPGDGIVPGSGTGADGFGDSLAVGDFNGDGHSDLAIGDSAARNLVGTVTVLDGSGTNAFLTATGAKIWTESNPSSGGDHFGTALAAGDFTGNGRTDLAVGIPGWRANGLAATGAVDVLYSAGSSGLTGTGQQHWTQGSPGLGTSDELLATFGTTLAAGDFDGNGRVDLAIGAVGATVSGNKSAGSVTVLAGGAAGLTATGSSVWTQASPGIAGTPEVGDFFGTALGTVRVTSSGHADLLVGIPDESITAGGSMEGGVELIPGSAAGLTATGSQFWSANSAGVRGTSCSGCGFGGAVD